MFCKNCFLLYLGSNASALAPCHHFLAALEEVQKDLETAGIEPDTFVASLFREMAALEEPKPGTVARILIPLLAEWKLAKVPEPNVQVKQLFSSSTFILRFVFR